MTALLALVMVTPSVSAEALVGNVTALGVLVEGPTTISSQSLRIHMGRSGDSFETPPGVVARAESVRVQRDFDERSQVCGPSGLCGFVDNQYAGGDHSESTYAQVTLQVQAWQPAQSEIFVGVGEGLPAGTGRVLEKFDRATPLSTLDKARSIKIGERDDFKQTNEVLIPAGTLTSASRPSSLIEFEGDFTLYLFGATFTVTDGASTSHMFETGFRTSSDASPGANRQWHNVTVLTFTKGSLAIEPRGNPVDAYLYVANLQGTGLVHFERATGLFKVDDRVVKQLIGEPVRLQGQYSFDVRTTRTQGLAAYDVGITGEFDGLSFSTSALRVASSGFPFWTWPLLLGVMAFGGSGAYVILRRRRKPEEATAAREQAAQVMANAPVHAADPTPVPVDSPPVNLKDEAPGLSWDAMTEEFGLIHAGEKAGVFVLLVPEERLGEFLHAVRGRGLIAEDTEDRVQAGEHALAVVALEPSPVAMN